MTINEEIRKDLLSQRDPEYRAFQQKVLPTIDPETMIGVRTPVLRKMAKTYAKREEIPAFLEALPHAYFDENQLHAFVISEEKDYDRCIAELNRFLPYVDNWATCDQMSPKVLKKHHDRLLTPIEEWLSSGKTYTIRFGIGALMEHFLEDDFSLEYPERVSRIRSEEYYVNMSVGAVGRVLCEHDDRLVFCHCAGEAVRKDPSLPRRSCAGSLGPQQGHSKIG